MNDSARTSSELLRRALGEPATVVLSGGHVTACVCLGAILREVDALLGL